uniref:Fatty acyl-CoA reductase n=1 Tax=Timema douglasi TaxID=61478 RepID=A0A7R8VI61_TIMDO|nr:unnamed protein product [Timema douglasi]
MKNQHVLVGSREGDRGTGWAVAEDREMWSGGGGKGVNEIGEDIPWWRSGENHVQNTIATGSFVKSDFPQRRCGEYHAQYCMTTGSLVKRVFTRSCGGERHVQYSRATGSFVKRGFPQWRGGENHALYSMTTDPFVERSSFFNNVFDVLKATNPEFHQKLVMVPGDCSLPKLGLSPSDYEMLTQQVNIILHLAATVRFDEKINIAVPMNIGGTKEIIDLGRACVYLKSIVYLSTAYSNCNRKEVEECFYDPPLEDDGVINFLTTLDEAVMEVIKIKFLATFFRSMAFSYRLGEATVINIVYETCAAIFKRISPLVMIIGLWPNTYTFTKAIAENIIKKTASDLPIAIVRPSQVSGTLKEPVCGWIDNVYGPNGVAAGFLAGLIRTGVSHEETKLNMVPVDMVANCIIASAFGATTSSLILDNQVGDHLYTLPTSFDVTRRTGSQSILVSTCLPTNLAPGKPPLPGSMTSISILVSTRLVGPPCWCQGKPRLLRSRPYSCLDLPCLSANLAPWKINAPSFVGTIYSCLDDPTNCRHGGLKGREVWSGGGGKLVRGVGKEAIYSRQSESEEAWSRDQFRPISDGDHISKNKQFLCATCSRDCNKHIPIYNFVSGPNTLTFQENTNLVLEKILEVPSAQAIWYPWGHPFRSVFWYRVFAIFVHVIPGALLDIAFVIKGNPPMFLKIYRKIDKYMLSMKYFTTFNWNFYNRKCMSLYQSLAQEDKEIFYFDSNAYDSRDYLRRCIYGLRIYLFKESPDTIPAGKSRLIRFYIAHQIIKALLLGLIAWITWHFMSSVK